jgi:hypothetical protein
VEFCFKWSGNRILFQVEWKWNSISTVSFSVLEMESFGVLERIVLVSRKRNSVSVQLGNGCFVSWCFFVRTYSGTTVEAKTRSLSERSCVEMEMRSLSERSSYIIISLCCSLKNNRMLIVS